MATQMHACMSGEHKGKKCVIIRFIIVSLYAGAKKLMNKASKLLVANTIIMHTHSYDVPLSSACLAAGVLFVQMPGVKKMSKLSSL